jgi:hypothetical protein
MVQVSCMCLSVFQLKREQKDENLLRIGGESKEFISNVG